MIHRQEVPTYTLSIHVAGDFAEAARACAAYAYDVGLCVTVQPQRFIYTGGAEEGVCVGLINYPRFPATPEKLWSRAEGLALNLIVRLHQHSASIVGPDRTVWLTRRAQDADVTPVKADAPNQAEPQGGERP